MTVQYFTVLTDYGTQAFAKALATNQPLRLSSFAVGDGNGQTVTPTADRTALVKETHRANVSAVSLDPRNNKQIIIELTIPEDVGGFYIREMGVFDSANKLVAYANAPESFKPTLESGSGKVQVLRMILKVSNSQAVTLSIDNSVIFVTRQQLNPQKITSSTTNGFDESGHSHEIEKADTTKAGIVQLTDDTGLDSDKLGLSARAGKKLAQLISTVQLALGNYIPNNKKSNSVTSNSNDNVATSSAVQIAYSKGVEARSAADKAQQTANDGVSRARAAHQRADEVNNNANNRVSKFGDTVSGILRTVGITSKQFGFGSYNSQYDSGAPFMVEETGSKDRDTYHPFVKGRVRSNNHYGAAFSFGYVTKQGDGDGFGRGIIQLIEDNGKTRLWGFEHDGEFRSAGDVKTSSGASLNNAIQSNKISHATNGTEKDKVASEYALGELHKQLQINEHVVWQGSSNNAITVNLPFEKGVLFVCVTKSWGAGTIDNMWLSAPIANCHNTSIGDQDAGGSAGDYNFSMALNITKSGKSVTLTPGNARKPIIKKVVVVGV